MSTGSRRRASPFPLWLIFLTFLLILLVCVSLGQSTKRRSLEKETRAQSEEEEETNCRKRAIRKKTESRETEAPKSSEESEQKEVAGKGGEEVQQEAKRVEGCRRRANRKKAASNEVAMVVDMPKVRNEQRKEQRSVEEREEEDVKEEREETTTTRIHDESESTSGGAPELSGGTPPGQGNGKMLEFDTFAPGFFPSSPGFSDEDRAETTSSSSTKEIGKEAAVELILLDSTNNGTISEREAINKSTNTGNTFWEFERVELLNDNNTSTGVGLPPNENATISADISAGNESFASIVEDAEIFGTTIEDTILERNTTAEGEAEGEAEERGTTATNVEANNGEEEEGRKENGTTTTTLKMEKEVEKDTFQQDKFFDGANSTEISCEDESREAAEIQKSVKNATKGRKPAENEFFAGVDELNDDKENIVVVVEGDGKDGEEEAEEGKRTMATSTTSRMGGAGGDVKTKLQQMELAEDRMNATITAKPMLEVQLVDRAVSTSTTERASSVSTDAELKRTSTPATLRWTPYTFNCDQEVDDRGTLLCQEWARGGLCEINKATRFLFCRRTCLCIGVQK